VNAAHGLERRWWLGGRSFGDSGDSAGRSILRRSWFGVWGVDVDKGCVVGPGVGDNPNTMLLADCAPLDGLDSRPSGDGPAR